VVTLLGRPSDGCWVCGSSFRANPLDANTFNKRSISRMLESFGFTDVRWIRESPDFANLLARRQWGSGPSPPDNRLLRSPRSPALPHRAPPGQ